MELSKFIKSIPYAEQEVYSFIKKWKDYVTGNDTPEDFDSFTSKGNPIAGSGSFNLNKEQKDKFQKSWPDIKEAFKKIVEGDSNNICKSLKDARTAIEAAVTVNGKGTPSQQINRMLITIGPDYLINIPNEEITNIFAKQLIVFGYNEEWTDNDWIDRSVKIKAFIDEKLSIDKNQYVNYWSIWISLKKIDDMVNLLTANYNLILTGAPGTGKTYLARLIATEMIGCEDEKLKDSGRFGFVQFHPSYDYTDFVEGLRPAKKGETNEIGFERKDGIFMDFCRKALEDYNKTEKKEDSPKYVFVIDEINRGEISKIFGELFFSIDPDYRGVKGAVSTQYSNLWKDNPEARFDNGEKFYVPENVYIIGTMNDIDRSVESMDFAFRRRFAFHEIKAEDRIDDILGNLNPKVKKVAEKKMEAINNIIGDYNELGLGQQYKLGPAYFKKIEKYGGDAKWKNLWENHIEGVLREYLRGRPSTDIEKAIDNLKKAYDEVPNKGDNDEGDNTGGQPNNPESETEAANM